MFQEWIPNDHFTATKNPHYWRAGLPYLDSITYKPIPDRQQLAGHASSRAAVDIIHTYDPQSHRRILRNNQSLGLHRRLRPRGRRARHGLHAAQPVQGALRQSQGAAGRGHGHQLEPSTCTVIDYGVNAASTGRSLPASPYYPPHRLPAHNLAKAKQLVKELKHETGKPVIVHPRPHARPRATRDRRVLPAQLQTAGMQRHPQQVQQAELINDALLGTFEALLWRQFGAVDPDLNYIFWSPTNDQLRSLHQHGPQQRPQRWRTPCIKGRQPDRGRS